MLQFDSKGLLIPNTAIKLTGEEFRFYFVDSIPSETRLDNFKKYISYSNELKKILKVDKLKQWIDGSFVTLIRNPKDIDFVTFLDFELRLKFLKELKKFEAKGANEIFGVDAYLLTVFPENHSKEFLFHSDKAYWNDRFSRTRRDAQGKKRPKGYIEIIY